MFLTVKYSARLEEVVRYSARLGGSGVSESEVFSKVGRK